MYAFVCMCEYKKVNKTFFYVLGVQPSKYLQASLELCNKHTYINQVEIISVLHGNSNSDD